MRSTALKITVGLLALASAGIVSSGPTTDARSPLDVSYHVDANLPVPVSARLVCRLVEDNPSAAAATVLGVDGAASAVVDGTAYWFFGDTFRQGPGGRRDVIPAAIASTADFDAADCLAQTFKTDRDSIVQPMFPRLDETTAWPDGVLTQPDGSIIFYMVKVIRTSPTDWRVGSVGLGVLPAGSLEGVRLVETIWDAESGFRGRITGARSPVRVGDDVLVYISTDAGNYLARAAAARLGDSSAYTYWDGTAWAIQPYAAHPLWPPPPSVLPHDNGLSVTFDERLGKWLAVYNADLLRVEARIADEPWGPWSEPVIWFDCQSLVPSDVYPLCYSSALHPELSRNAGSTIYVTFSNPEPYDVSLVELNLGVPVHGWMNEEGLVRYAPRSPEESYTDLGVAFYASDAAVPGLAAVYETSAQDGYRYGLASPAENAVPVFFAYAEPPIGGMLAQPVYQTERDGRAILDVIDVQDEEQAEVVFHVPCLHAVAASQSLVCASETPSTP